jgi:hypothetical protein
MVLLVWLMLTLAFGWGTLISARQFFMYSFMGAVFSGLGGRLAIQYHYIK